MLSLVHTGRLYTLYSRRFQRLYSRQNGDMVAENSRLPFWQLYIEKYTTVVALFDDYMQSPISATKMATIVVRTATICRRFQRL